MAHTFCPHCMTETGPEVQICPNCGGDTSVQNVGSQLPVGTVLVSPGGHSYLLGAAKGQGGFGITYISRDMESGRLAAIKEYHPARCQPRRLEDGTLQPQTESAEAYRHGLTSFLREAGMLKAAEDIPSVVDVLDYFEANGTAYMVMEYLQGLTLQRLVESQGTTSFDELMGQMTPFLKDIAAMHSKTELIHRDIAPDNIMLMPDGTFKLMDFGCARAMEDGKSMTVLLKPGFAPLEQYTTHGQGPYTDLYALCATIYYCITGQIPPAAPDRMVALQGKPDPLRPPSELGAEIGQEEEQVLMWGLGLQPGSRPQTVSEFLVRLGLEAPPMHPLPLEPPDPPKPHPIDPEPPRPDPVTYDRKGSQLEAVKTFLQKNKLLVGIAAAVILLLLIFGR